MTFTKQLTYVPVDKSEHVYVNGVEQQTGTDYTLDSAAGQVTLPSVTKSGDLVEVMYAHLGQKPVFL